jgi:hypothetical protein
MNFQFVNKKILTRKKILTKLLTLFYPKIQRKIIIVNKNMNFLIYPIGFSHRSLNHYIHTHDVQKILTNKTELRKWLKKASMKRISELLTKLVDLRKWRICKHQKILTKLLTFRKIYASGVTA